MHGYLRRVPPKSIQIMNGKWFDLGVEIKIYSPSTIDAWKI